MANLNIDDPTIILIALAVNLIIGFAALKLKLVDNSGFYTGVALGTLVFSTFNWQGFLILLTFFVLGSAATKFKSDKKKNLQIEQKKGGARSAKHVIANGLVPFSIAGAVAVSTDITPADFQFYFAAFTAAVATALGDTLSTEMGQVQGKRTYLLITMERVKPGTEGGVSLEGAYWGLAGILAVALLAAGLGMFPLYPMKTVILVLFAAAIANLVESIIGGIFNQFEKSANEFLLNLTNTVVGAGLCMFFVH